jgi:hypothetical protein
LYVLEWALVLKALLHLSQAKKQTCQNIQVLVKNLLSRFSVGTYPNIRYPAYPINSLFWRGWIL